MAGSDKPLEQPKQGPANPAQQPMPLGQVSAYVDRYSPELLYSLPRSDARSALDWPLGVQAAALEFAGEDLWTAYELSWLESGGRPNSAILSLRVPCNSPSIVESKSMKLYLNSFAQTRFRQQQDLASTIQQDLGAAFGAPVLVELRSPHVGGVEQLPGECLDQLDVELTDYHRNPSLLRTGDQRLTRHALYTHQFRSLCPVTGQPDFASIWIEYSGPQVDPGALFAYLVSYRTHTGFHESAIEQIYLDLLGCCDCSELTVYGRFLRRGGIDINPLRASHNRAAPSWRLARQ